MTKIITSARDYAKPNSWLAYQAVNMCNPDEGEGWKVPETEPRLFPGRYGAPIGPILKTSNLYGGAILTNVDIELTTPSLGSFNKPGVVTFARRIEHPTMKLNRWGIDVIIVPPDLYTKLALHDGWRAFQFGAPWWDVLVPTAAAILGFKLQRIDAPVAYHQTHKQRWSNQDWSVAGLACQNCLTQMAERSGRYDFPHGGDLFEWHHAVRRWRDDLTESVSIPVAPPIIQEAVWREATRPDEPKKPRGLLKRLARSLHL